MKHYGMMGMIVTFDTYTHKGAENCAATLVEIASYYSYEYYSEIKLYFSLCCCVVLSLDGCTAFDEKYHGHWLDVCSSC